jgi:hypothetical protein
MNLPFRLLPLCASIASALLSLPAAPAAFAADVTVLDPVTVST